MKKIISLFLISAIFMTFVSCGSKKSLPQDTSCEAILTAIEQVIDMPKYEKLYLKSEDNFDSYSMSLWRDAAFSDFDQSHIIEDYAIFLGEGVETFEIAILKFSDSTDKATKEEIFEKRKKTLAAGDKGAYDPNFENTMNNAVVHIDGNFAIMLITKDNDKALEAIENLKK
ncbi:MAG: DUF4358 domain-containing protein [Clostridia bacterium]|nr:DUF4358 domain-containing protein [Clostridia bacterium]